MPPFEVWTTNLMQQTTQKQLASSLTQIRGGRLQPTSSLHSFLLLLGTVMGTPGPLSTVALLDKDVADFNYIHLSGLKYDRVWYLVTLM